MAQTMMFERRHVLLALCILGVLSASCGLGLPTTVDCPWSIVGPGQIRVGEEKVLQVFLDSGAAGLPTNLGCNPMAGAGPNTEVVRWVSADLAVATVRNATNTDPLVGQSESLFLAAVLKGVSPGSTSVVAFIAPVQGAREVESRPLTFTVIP